MGERLRTVRGHGLSEVASALQKTIRRGDARLAGYFAVEMFESHYTAYCWRRLLTISAEDCAGVITQEIKALYDAWVVIDAQKKGNGRIFLAKAVVLLCRAAKSRDADHLTNLVYDAQAIDTVALDAALEDARRHPEPIPEYAHDVHTREGKRRGKTKTEFFVEEHNALSPRVPGFFDADLTKMKGVNNMGDMELKAVRLAVLRALSTRTTGSGYSPVEVEGLSFEEVQTALRDLKRRGLIVGEELEGLGRRPEVEVSGLTDAGRVHLRALAAELTGSVDQS